MRVKPIKSRNGTSLLSALQELPALLFELSRGESFCSLTIAAVEELDRVAGRSTTAAVRLFPVLGETISSSEMFLAAETACAGEYQNLEAQIADVLTSSRSSTNAGSPSDNSTADAVGADGAV